MTSIATIAADAVVYFGQIENPAGESIWTVAHGHAPEWITELVQNAHGAPFGTQIMPDDRIYDLVHDALQNIANAETFDVDANRQEFADDAVDIYTGDRLKWIASNLNRVALCDEAAHELDLPGTDLVGLIGAGQYAEAEAVFNSVYQTLEDRWTELDDQAADDTENDRAFDASREGLDMVDEARALGQCGD